MLKINDLQVSYGVTPVLHDLAITVSAGEIVALLGENGAGKTSLLNAISGILTLEKGEIEFRRKDILELSPAKIVDLGIVQISEGRTVFPFLTVLENLFMGASLPHIWSGRFDTLEKVYSLFPILKERTNQRAGLMSSGEQQMLVIARGLMARPKLLMIDEPSLGLSSFLIKQIFNAISSVRDDKTSVLLSEKNMQPALKTAGRGYILQNGHMVMEDSAPRLLKSELVRNACVRG